jgi:hypothetical protein
VDHIIELVSTDPIIVKISALIAVGFIGWLGSMWLLRRLIGDH